MIERLQRTSHDAVVAMDQSHQQVEAGVESTQQIGSELEDIFSEVAALEDMGRAIATAAEEQSSVSREISRNVHRISEAAAKLAVGSRCAGESGSAVSTQAADLQALIKRFSR